MSFMDLLDYLIYAAGIVAFFWILWREIKRSRRMGTLQPEITTQCGGTDAVPPDANLLFDAPKSFDPEISGDIWLKEGELYVHSALLADDARSLSYQFRKTYLCVSLKDVVECTLASENVYLLMMGIKLEISIYLASAKAAETLHAVLKAEVERLNAA